MPAKIELGRQLFFDDRLSANGTVSCDQCHSPAKAEFARTPFAGYEGQTKGQTDANTIGLTGLL
jgi:cytochrome c peroxidase